MYRKMCYGNLTMVIRNDLNIICLNNNISLYILLLLSNHDKSVFFFGGGVEDCIEINIRPKTLYTHTKYTNT